MSCSDYTARLYPAATCNEQTLQKLWQNSYPVKLIDGTYLEIPLTPLPGGDEGIALLMSNQCDFSVTDHLISLMSREAAALEPDVVAAVPTMGLEYASMLARKLGHENYVAMGFSRKFWYEEELGEDVRSSTSSSQLKRLYLDPHLLDRVRGRRVLLLDDVINTGASAAAAARLLVKLGAELVGTLVALTEGYAWQKVMSGPEVGGGSQVIGLGHIPLFVRQGAAWTAKAGT